MKKRLLLFLLANGIFFGFAQNPIIVVDGFFLKLNKNEIIEYIGIENIKDTIIISPDSAKVLLGIYSKNGWFIINTKEPNSKLSTTLRVDRNLFFENKPVFLINDNIINDFDINMVDPNDVDSIVIIHPYNSIKEYGIDYAGGIINVWLNNDSLSKYLSKNIPLNFNEIKTISLTDEYSILLKRYLHNDTTLLLRDFQILYYGQAYQNNFNPYSRHDSIQALNILLNKPIESIGGFKSQMQLLVKQ